MASLLRELLQGDQLPRQRLQQDPNELLSLDTADKATKASSTPHPVLAALVLSFHDVFSIQADFSVWASVKLWSSPS